MRYTYTLYDGQGQRKDITTRAEEIPAQLALISTSAFIIHVTDNLTHEIVKMFYSLADFEEWYDQACMVAQWQDADAIAANREKIKRNGCPVCKAPWNPFDEQETDIHVNTAVASGICDKIMGMKPPPGINPCLDLPEPGVSPYREEAKAIFLADKNLKTAAAVGKPQMSGIPPIGIMALGMAMQDGVNKYGLFNWRETGVTASVFYDAMLRHLLAWYSGEDHAPDSGVVHLGHLMAGAAIILDADYHGVLNDDRVEGRPVNLESLSFIKK